MRKNEFLTENKYALNEFIKLSRCAGSRPDYVQGGGGNTSVKLNGELMAIKASGFCLSDLSESNAYAVLDYIAVREFFKTSRPVDFGNIESAGAQKVKDAIYHIEGLPELRPSVEAGFHSLLDTFVLHSHSVYANLAACSKNIYEIMNTAFSSAGYTWGIVPYVNPGARLTYSVQDELARVEAKSGKTPAVLLMQNHGIIVHHSNYLKCEEIHSDANERVAKIFGKKGNSFPRVSIKEAGGGLFVSDTPFLADQLLSGNYSENYLLREPLYPDQLVFLNGTFSFDGEPESGKCTLNPNNGLVTYNMTYKQALVVEETLAAVTFIISTIKNAGHELSVMGKEAKEFIANWESEQFRKSLVTKA